MLFLVIGIVGYGLFFLSFFLLRRFAIKNEILMNWKNILFRVLAIFFSHLLGLLGVLLKEYFGYVGVFMICMAGSFTLFLFLQRGLKDQTGQQNILYNMLIRSISISLDGFFVVTFWYAMIGLLFIIRQ